MFYYLLGLNFLIIFKLLRLMLLKEFLQKEKIKKKSFSKTIKTSAMAVSYYCFGKRMPTAEVMERIFEATNGRVTPNDFYNLKTEEVKNE